MNTETPPGGVTRGSRTSVRRAQPPHLTDPRVLLLLTVAWAVLIAAHQFL